MQQLTARIMNEFLGNEGEFSAPDHRSYSSWTGMASSKGSPTPGPTLLHGTWLLNYDGLIWDWNIVPQISLEAVKA
jgi:hypothetical protein